MPRRTRFRSNARSARLTQWIGPANQGYVNVASGGATLLASASFEDPVTQMRARGQVSVVPQSFGSDVTLVGAFGICVVSTEAFNVGITAIPEPFTDADWGGWYVWRSFSYRWEFATAEASNPINWNFEIDSKAMRKVSANETIVQIAESQVGAFSISTPIRELIKLP